MPERILESLALVFSWIGMFEVYSWAVTYFGRSDVHLMLVLFFVLVILIVWIIKRDSNQKK